LWIDKLCAFSCWEVQITFIVKYNSGTKCCPLGISVILFGRDFRFQFGSYEFSISTFSSAFRGIGDVNPTILA
jgi:hypothetical protein